MRLDAAGITVRIGSKTIVDQATLSADAGEFIGLIGPNGAGKSTLIRVLANLLRPAAGTVLCDGRPLGSFMPTALARQISYLAQGTVAHWPMTVDQLVALGRLPYRRAGRSLSDEDRDAVARAMTRTDLDALGGRTLSTLSGGERMRVMLARALAVEAPILMVDEPVAALDPFHQLQIMAVLRETAHRGTAVIAILHELTLAARFCDRIVLLSDGRVQANGSPVEVLTAENLAASYGIDSVMGDHDNQRYVIPWSRIG